MIADKMAALLLELREYIVLDLNWDKMQGPARTMREADLSMIDAVLAEYYAERR